MKYLIVILLIGCGHYQLSPEIESSKDITTGESLARRREQRNLLAEKIIVDCYSKKNYDVRAATRASLDKNTESFSYWSNIGSCYLHQGSPSKALFFYKLSSSKAKSREDKATLANNMGTLLTKNNQIPEAISKFEEAIKLNPNLVTPRLNLAMIFSQYKLKKNAMSILKNFKRSKDPQVAYLVNINQENESKLLNNLPLFITDEEKSNIKALLEEKKVKK